MSLFALGTASAGVFYTVSQRVQQRGLLVTVLHLPMLMSIGIGIALNNARGCLEALIGYDSPFVRTPKYNTKSELRHSWPPIGDGDCDTFDQGVDVIDRSGHGALYP